MNLLGIDTNLPSSAASIHMENTIWESLRLVKYVPLMILEQISPSVASGILKIVK